MRITFMSSPRPGALRRPLAALLCWLACWHQAVSADELAREYRIKAAFLYNLSKFVTWPDEATAADTPLTICIYGYNPFERYLEKLQERTVKGRPIAIRYIAEKATIDGCQLVFMSRHNTSQPALLKAPPPYPPVLTVGDDAEFLAQGGLVSLVRVSNSVQLDINLTRAKQAGFKVSANLLEVARKVE